MGSDAADGMKQHALEYAAQGWRLIPIWPMRDGICGCGNPYCKDPGKHPLLQRVGRGMAGASADARQVAEWWDRWPDANIAAAMGVGGSGFAVVDLDFKDDVDGEVEFNSFLDGYGIDRGDPRISRTGSGGRHLVYQLPEGTQPVKSTTGWLPCVDVRADGGYILLPPSNHESGGTYEWLTSHAPGLIPDALLTALRAARNAPGASPDAPSYDYRDACKSGPRRGTRDHFFNARAFELRKADWDYERAKVELRRHWESTEQTAGDEWPWSEVISKLDRVWSEVDADPLPQWDPMAAQAAPSGRSSAAAGGAPDKKATDLGNSERFAEWHEGEAAYTMQAGWLIWDGTRWAGDDLERSTELAKDTIRKMFVEAAMIPDVNTRDTRLDWARQSESRGHIESMVRLARSDPRISRSVLDFDLDPWLFNCVNGTIDLRTGELQPHRREDLITKQSPVRFMPGATSQKLGQFLRGVTAGDMELIDYLRRAAGYTLSASTREEVFFMVYGPKWSGKSTFVDGLLTVMGDMGMMTQADTLTHIKGSQAPKDELAAMLAKRLVATVEIQEGERFAEALVKQLTGGDKIAARQLYKTRFEFQPQFKLWIATNHAPRAYDDALWRRIKRVPFPNEVPAVQRDPALKEALKDPRSEESEAFLAWMVRGCLEWQAQGLGTASAVEQDTEEYREEQDKFGRFLDERCKEDVGAETTSRALYASYSGWCVDEGERPMTATAFGIKLKDRGFVKNAKVRPIRWKGVAVRDVGAYGIDVDVDSERESL